MGAFACDEKKLNDKLETIYLPESLISVGSEAFHRCKNLKDVYMYKSTKKEKNGNKTPFEKKVKIHYLDK